MPVNSAAQEAEIVAPNAPEAIKSWNEFYNDYGRQKYGADHWVDMSPDHWFTKLGNTFTGDVDYAKAEYEKYVKDYEQNYQNYLNDLNRYYEDKATQSARSWDEKMSNSQYSRTFEDLKKAGINPYMLLQSGSVSPATYNSSAKADYKGNNKAVSRSSIQDSKSDSKGRDFALVLLAVARLIATIA